MFNGAGYTDPTKNPFAAANFDVLNSLDGVNNYKFGSSFSEYTIDFEAGTVDVNDLVVLEKGTIDLPVHNSQYDTKENCFFYLTEWFTEEVKDEDYAWKLVKYDRCNQQKLAEFRGVSNEATFIADPNGTLEDDGLILTQVFDHTAKLSKVVAINPNDMTMLNEYALPFHIPFSVHSFFMPATARGVEELYQ